ncbi:MAG: exonuclease domain-containing protein [Clostridia bacterium]|nr:exonuclease domain-containing protein [Clostridia bacterium]
MTYVILDLEWNSAYSKKRRKYINEIFEFGAVKIDDSMNVIDSFSMLVRPQIGKFMNPYVKKLTNVTFEELQEAENTYTEAIRAFADFLSDSVLLTWSTSDLLALLDNQHYFTGVGKLSFMKRYCDLQSYCEHILGVGSASRQLGLSTCAELMNITADGEQHRALTDAQLSYKCLKKIFRKHVLEEFIEDSTDDEFYRKLTFKSKHITDIRNPLVDRSKMFFDCPECSARCVQKSKWNVKSRSFKAFFVCPECKNEFAGQVFVKQKYEGVVFTKKIIEPEQPQENEASKTSENNNQ